MKRALWLALFAVGCVKSDPAPAREQASASASPAPSIAPSAPKPPLALAPLPSSAARSEREARVRSLLAGEAAAFLLPEVATEVGEGLDLDLREELAPRKKTKLALEKLQARGALDEPAARRTLDQARPRLRGCYERGHARNPMLQGKVRLELSLAADGRVMSAKLLASDVPDQGVTRCLEQRAARLGFPAADGGTSTLDVTLDLAPE